MNILSDITLNKKNEYSNPKGKNETRATVLSQTTLLLALVTELASVPEKGGVVLQHLHIRQGQNE